MHLLGHQYSTINTKKRKVKYTRAQQESWTKEWRAQNKWNKQRGFPSITLEEFIDQLHGKTKRVLKQPTLSAPQTTNYRETQPYPSKSDEGVGIAGKQEPKVYDGERKLLGIATMHKSNMVPVFDQESAKDIANMRRN